MPLGEAEVRLLVGREKDFVSTPPEAGRPGVGSPCFGLCRGIRDEDGAWSLAGMVDWVSAQEVRAGVSMSVFGIVRVERPCQVHVRVIAPDRRAADLTPPIQLHPSDGPMRKLSCPLILSRENLRQDGTYALWLMADGQPINAHILAVGMPPQKEYAFALPAALMGPRERHISCFLPCVDAIQDSSGAWTLERVFDSVNTDRFPFAPPAAHLFLRGFFARTTTCQVRLTGPHRRPFAESGSWTGAGYATHALQFAGLAFPEPGIWLFDLLCDGEVGATFPVEVRGRSLAVS